MKLLFGTRLNELKINTATAQIPEELEDRMLTKSMPYYIQVEGKRIRLSAGAELHLACEIVAAYHAAFAAPDDGFSQHTEYYEQHIADRLEHDPSSDSDKANSEDDMVYERCAYR